MEWVFFWGVGGGVDGESENDQKETKEGERRDGERNAYFVCSLALHPA